MMAFVNGMATNPWAELLVSAFKSGVRWAALYVIVYSLYHWLRLHERFGFFKTQEPKSHFQGMIRNWKVPFMWGFSFTALPQLVGLDLTVSLNESPHLLWSLPPQWVFVPRGGLWTDILYAIIGYYLMDFVDYWTHRINHQSDHLYRSFPYGHFVHHNCIFLTPLSISSAPPVQLLLISTWVVYIGMLSQGLLLSVLIMQLARQFAGAVAHFGFDPLPWLSRLNHRVGGWIPWLPLHHQYHHLPNVKYGNYGNMSVLWDYVFGTTIPECSYHLEHGQPTPEVRRFIDNAETELATYFKDRGHWSLPATA